MRTLYDTPCNRVRVGRRTYKIKAPFDTVLFCLQALKSDDMSEADKIRLCVALLVVHPPRSMTEKEKVFRAVLAAINEEPEKQDEDKPPCMDFEQDAEYIRAAFWHVVADVLRPAGRSHGRDSIYTHRANPGQRNATAKQAQRGRAPRAGRGQGQICFERKARGSTGTFFAKIRGDCFQNSHNVTIVDRRGGDTKCPILTAK